MAITVLVSESSSIVSSGQIVYYYVTISNSSTAAVQVTAIQDFNSDGGMGSVTSPLPLVPGAVANVPGVAYASYQFIYFNYNGTGPRTVTSNCTVYASDGSVATCGGGSPQALVFNPNVAPYFATQAARIWQLGQANFACLQDSSLFVPLVATPASTFIS